MVALPADNVTEPPSCGADALLNARPSLLPFDPKDMMAIRVRPAGFAAMCGVSRQSVSQWVRKGWISLGPDGLLDPVSAMRQLLSRADPARLRARIFREATATLGELRARIQSLEAEVAGAKAAGQAQCQDEFAKRIADYSNAILDRFEELQAAHAAGTADEWIDLLEGRVFWRFDDQAMRDLQACYGDSRETHHTSNGVTPNEDAAATDFLGSDTEGFPNARGRQA